MGIALAILLAVIYLRRGCKFCRTQICSRCSILLHSFPYCNLAVIYLLDKFNGSFAKWYGSTDKYDYLFIAMKPGLGTRHGHGHGYEDLPIWKI